MNKTIVAFAVVMLAAGASAPASATAYNVLHNFCQQKNCTDGSQPITGLIGDGAGGFFGTAQANGANDEGVVYRLSKDGSKWSFNVLYAFCSQKNCKDGAIPKAGLIVDANGNLYGLASVGGADGDGAVYQLSPSGDQWIYKVLYSFCSKSNCSDGAVPALGRLAYQGAMSGAPYDGKSPLYGVTDSGGAHGGGVLFSLTPNKSGWTEKVVHAFCAKASCADGGAPFGTPLVDDSGNVFGTVPMGGANGRGAVYETQRNGDKWKFVLLHSFCSDQSSCIDGATPVGGLFQDDAGDLYGATEFGGSNPGSTGTGGGTVFKLVPNGVHSKHIKLHDFCAEANCTDGENPEGALSMDTKGNLIGTTANGGIANNGTLYRLGGAKLTTFTHLLDFNGLGTPGLGPYDAPLVDAHGWMFGVTVGGGTNGNSGLIYEYKP